MLDLLPDNPIEIARYQLVASASLAFASALVAILSFWMAKLNTLGSPPILIISGYDTEFYDDEQFHCEMLNIHAEIWNRRKYPLGVHHYECHFEDEFFDASVGRDMYPPEDGVAQIEKSFAFFNMKHHVDAANKKYLKIELPLARKRARLHGNFNVVVFAFDPVKKKKIRLFAKDYIGSPPNFYDKTRDIWGIMLKIIEGPRRPWMNE